MTPLIILSVACTAFICGFALGLMGFAITWEFFGDLPDDEAGAPEGDQTTKFGQRSPSR